MNQKTAQILLEKVKKDYSHIADEFDVTRQKDWKEFDGFLKYIKKNDSIADLGCGNGRFLKFIAPKRKVKYLGIDNNKDLLKKATPKENFLHGDLLSLPLDNESVDVAISIAALHHIPSKKLRKKAVQEIHRIIKKDGILILTSWNLFQKKYKKYIWKAKVKFLLSLGKYDIRDTFIPWGKTGVDRYYYAFTYKELKTLLLNSGFEIIDSQKGNNFVFICRKK